MSECEDEESKTQRGRRAAPLYPSIGGAAMPAGLRDRRRNCPATATTEPSAGLRASRVPQIHTPVARADTRCAAVDV